MAPEGGLICWLPVEESPSCCTCRHQTTTSAEPGGGFVCWVHAKELQAGRAAMTADLEPPKQPVTHQWMSGSPEQHLRTGCLLGPCRGVAGLLCLPTSVHHSNPLRVS